MILRRDRLDIEAIHKRLGPYWRPPQALGEDAWWFYGPGEMKIIVSYDPDTEPGVEWIHASISHAIETRYPSYNDLKTMHHGVFGDGFAYQCFVPVDKHINIRSNVLHLWGRLDGKPALPDFGRHGTI
jgi:hypothetical protein